MRMIPFEVKCYNSDKELQNDPKNLSQWAKTWQMKFSADKCKESMEKNQTLNYVFMMLNTDLEITAIGNVDKP